MEVGALMSMAGELSDVLPLEILPDSDRYDLAQHMYPRRFKAGEVVYHRGDPAAHLYVVHEGLVKALLLDEDGHEALVALFGRGEFFGELVLFEESPRDATVVAIVPSTVLQLSRADCLRVLDRNPRAREFMFRRLSATIRRLTDVVEGLVFLDVPGRLAKYLLEVGRSGQSILTQDDLAAAIGSSRVTVNKVLADFEKRGLISVDRRRVTVLDEPQLRRQIHH